MKKLISTLMLMFFISLLVAQAPDTLWTQTYDGVESDRGNCVNHTNDGGYIITGSTESFGEIDKDIGHLYVFKLK